MSKGISLALALSLVVAHARGSVGMVLGIAIGTWSVDGRTFLEEIDDSHGGLKETAIGEESVGGKISPEEISAWVES